MPVAIVFAFIAGVLTIVAPCSLPVLPVVLAGGGGPGRRRLLGVAAGFAGSFLLLTFLLASTLAALGLTAGPLRWVAAAAIGVGGLVLVVPFLGRLAERLMAPVAAVPPLAPRDPRGGGFWGGAAIGGAIGLIWAPCVGPLMGPVIAAAVVEGPSIEGMAIGAAYVAGALVPLVAIAALGRRVTGRAGGPAMLARRGLGIAMVVAAAAVLTGTDVRITAALTAMVPPPAATDGDTSVAPSPAADVAVDLPDLGPAAELTGITAWINSEPTTLAAYRGRVVLVHFWTFGCINCVHVQPYVKAWYDEYAAQGFTVIGVHTPELSFEREIANVREAVTDAAVRFPVAFDPDFATWRAFDNRYWPAFYLIDKRGHLRRATAGEGGYAEEEAAIRALLAEPG